MRTSPATERRPVGSTRSAISIALATCNGEAYLCEQLTSLARQDVAPFEMVVTDDASTDGTREIIERFSREAPFPVRFAENERRLGYVENSLRALSLCTGDYIAFCDRDDVWAPNKLSTIAREFERSDGDLVIHVAAVVSDALVPNDLQRRPIRRSRIIDGADFNPGSSYPERRWPPNVAFSICSTTPFGRIRG